MSLFKAQPLDLAKTKTFDVWERHNLVRIDTLANTEDDVTMYENEELYALAKKIIAARNNGKPVVLFFGAHVIKSGLSRYLIHWIREGYVTHLASNGAGSIHDFEIAYLGGTSEHVPTAIEDGSFGMWEQTGLWMNQAINLGYPLELGYGGSLGHYIQENPEQFPYQDDCLLYQAYLAKVPATYHITIGTDIIHQHPAANFYNLGGASGRDFAIFANSIKDLEGGVFMNVGSAVTGPEIFLKALSICRNQGYTIGNITTANFDIIPLGDYKSNITDQHFHYYYRPRKNVINRPTSLGGTGLYVYGNHLQTIPTLHKLLTAKES